MHRKLFIFFFLSLTLIGAQKQNKKSPPNNSLSEEIGKLALTKRILLSEIVEKFTKNSLVLRTIAHQFYCTELSSNEGVAVEKLLKEVETDFNHILKQHDITTDEMTQDEWEPFSKEMSDWYEAIENCKKIINGIEIAQQSRKTERSHKPSYLTKLLETNQEAFADISSINSITPRTTIILSSFPHSVPTELHPPREDFCHLGQRLRKSYDTLHRRYKEKWGSHTLMRLQGVMID